VAVKLTTMMDGLAIQNPTTEYQPIFHQGTEEKYFKWITPNLKSHIRISSYVPNSSKVKHCYLNIYYLEDFIMKTNNSTVGPI
jgi:hypothetical protein